MGGMSFPRFLAAVTLLAMCRMPIAVAAEPQSREQGMMDRLMNPDRKSKSAYQGKLFKTDAMFSGKKTDVGEYRGIRTFGTKSYGTAEYQGGGQSWLGKLLFPGKTLPPDLQGSHREAAGKFGVKPYATKAYSTPGKEDPYPGKRIFATHETVLKGKTQGAIDNDPKLQEAVRKGLSIDDVRKLLNKAP
jgi:hypothetical protein